MALRYTTPIFFLTAALTVSAQTISSDYNPLPGESTTGANCDYADPGAGGNDQTWDFSGLTCEDPVTATWVTPASTGFGSSFPGATVAQGGGGSFTFYSCTASAFEQMGLAATGYDLIYSDRLKTLQYPFSNGNSFTDAFAGPVNYSGQTFYQRSGNIVVSADGYGTVISPLGTVTNVLRVHSVQDYTDVESGGTSSIDYHYESYQWLKPGVKTPVVSIVEFNAIQDGTVLQEFQAAGIGALDGIGMDELYRNEFGVEAWPNPASGTTDLLFSTDGGLDLTIVMLDAAGREVRSWRHNTTAAGIQRRTLDVSGISPGPHVVRVMDQRGNTGTCRLVTF